MDEEDFLKLFTREEWAEIYYACDSKAKAIAAGMMGPQTRRGENRDWIEQFETIMARISDHISV